MCWVGKGRPLAGISLLKSLKCSEYKQAAHFYFWKQKMDLDTAKKLNYSRMEQLGPDRPDEAEVLGKLGNPTPDELVQMALVGLESPDRNYRFQMVRILGSEGGETAAKGMLKALSDPARRVRRCAAQRAGRFATFPGVVERLQEMIDDDKEPTKIRVSAVSALSTGQLRASLAKSSKEALEFFESIDQGSQHRMRALAYLIMQDPLTPVAESVLRELIEVGTKQEAVAATRAICGFKVVNLGAIHDAKERLEVAKTADTQWSSAWVWVPRGSTKDSGVLPQVD